MFGTTTFKTTADHLYELLSKKKLMTVTELAIELNTTERSVMKISRYLEEENLVKIEYKFKGPIISIVETVNKAFSISNKEEIIIILKEFKKNNNIEEAKKLIEDLFEFCKVEKDPMLNSMYKEVYGIFLDQFSNIIETKGASGEITIETVKPLDHYKVWHDNVVVDIQIVRNELEPVPFYNISLVYLQHTTELILEKIKDSIITSLDYETVFRSTADHHELIKEQFKTKIFNELQELFPNLGFGDIKMFVNYVIITSIGLGDVEFLLKDPKLEEIVINNAYEPIWVYHREQGWLKTNVILGDENKVRHFATIGGRNVDKNITNLEPLLDGHLESGDRFNATLHPISTKGNTITIRKFASKPFTIVDMIKKGSVTAEAAAIIWLAVQFEMSCLIVGGTGSGKTSALNVYSVFIQPNQRIVTIEDTRELVLANTLHWVPMQTRAPNPEGKGAVSMLDLIVNALRMRPDRILFGEIRKKEEAETLFEAMHTGHSVMATFHANNAEEAEGRITEPPIGLPKSMLSSLAFIMVVNRNRRTGQRVLLQLAEVARDGHFRVIKGFDYATNKMNDVAPLDAFYNYLALYGGLSKEQVDVDIQKKADILRRFVALNIDDMHDLGILMSKYYTNLEAFERDLGRREDKLNAEAAKPATPEGVSPATSGGTTPEVKKPVTSEAKPTSSTAKPTSSTAKPTSSTAKPAAQPKTLKSVTQSPAAKPTAKPTQKVGGSSKMFKKPSSILDTKTTIKRDGQGKVIKTDFSLNKKPSTKAPKPARRTTAKKSTKKKSKIEDQVDNFFADIDKKLK